MIMTQRINSLKQRQVIFLLITIQTNQLLDWNGQSIVDMVRDKINKPWTRSNQMI